MPKASPKILAKGHRFGSYRLESILGTGGQGQVYLATDVLLRRSIALKLFLFQQGQQSVALREARLIAALEHPHIIRIYQFGRTKKGWFIAMEYMRGGTVSERLAQGKLTTVQALSLAYQTAGALEEAHRAGVIHQDIKPQNLLLTERGVLKLSDFGLARKEGILKKGRIEGTPLFMAPEVWEGGAPTRGSDIYSLGACLYLFLCGNLPFPFQRVEALRHAHLHEEPDYSAVPEAQRDLIRACLQKDCKARPTSSEVRRELRHNLRQLKEGTIPPFPATSGAKHWHSNDAIFSSPPLIEAQANILQALQSGAPLITVVSPYDYSIHIILQKILGMPNAPLLLARFLIEKSTVLQSLLDDLNPSDLEKNQAFLVHIHLQRALSAIELDQLFQRATTLNAQKSFLITGVLEFVEQVRTHMSASGRESLLRQVTVRKLTAEERLLFVGGWAKALEIPGCPWSPDALRLLESLELQGFERIVHNTIVLAQRTRMGVVTTWTVLGAHAHAQRLTEFEELIPEWRHPPEIWPTPQQLIILKNLRSKLASKRK